MEEREDDFAGISPSEAEALRALLPKRKDFLALSSREGVELLRRLAKDRVTRNTAYHRTKATSRIGKMAETLGLRLDGMNDEERQALFAALMRKS